MDVMILPVFLIVFIAATASPAVLSAECPQRFPKEMRPLSSCCKVEMNPNSSYNSTAGEAIIDKCFGGFNSSATRPTGPPSGYDCEMECLMIEFGFMGKDKTINKDKIVTSIQDEYSADFQEAANKAIEICMGRKYQTSCPSGIDGMMECFAVQMMLNCPAKHWSGGEDCKETKQLIEKCGEVLSIFADYDTE
uniref:Odorant-binding protein 24 n=1 Tax=Adelphocoris lineolatus TaxID=236346 RepID=A0A346RVG9_ADELI|nr:odorant-binding protein 24 [Adelphocoris lineolatus]